MAKVWRIVIMVRWYPIICLLDVIFLKFYFVAFQYLCHVEDVDRHLRYPPVEMALMEYSLKEGRQKVWHTLTHPGEAMIHYTALSTLVKQYSLVGINHKVMNAATLKTILKISYSMALLLCSYAASKTKKHFQVASYIICNKISRTKQTASLFLLNHT